ncbi:hypothetical protein WME90_04470 [Sorangium sp. So ce375]|uniref:hypothetical protein n=1 Tax=Sorangium sp. So ce375 TaxID=3133306 RepID=UPI003F5B21EB
MLPCASRRSELGLSIAARDEEPAPVIGAGPVGAPREALSVVAEPGGEEASTALLWRA